MDYYYKWKMQQWESLHNDGSNLRQVCTEPIDCKNCGHLPEQFVEYYDGGGFCSGCAYDRGLIDTEQWLNDEDDNVMAGIQYAGDQAPETKVCHVTAEQVAYAMWCGDKSASKYKLPEHACPYSNPVFIMAYIWAYHARIKTGIAVLITKATANRRAGRDLWDKRIIK